MKFISNQLMPKIFCLFFVVIFFSSCEKDFRYIGVDLVDQKDFVLDSIFYDVVAYTDIKEKVRASTLQQYLLGRYENTDFGSIYSSIATQLELPVDAVQGGVRSGFGENPKLEKAVVIIPYQVTIREDSNGNTGYSIDSIFGSKYPNYQEIELKIYRLNTFMNNLDPIDPSKSLKYYTDKEYLKSEVLYQGSFKPDSSLTKFDFDRTNLDGTVYERDQYTNDDKPFIVLELDKSKINQIFFPDLLSKSLSGNNRKDSLLLKDDYTFKNEFRGLYIEARLNDYQNQLLSLDLSQAKMTFFFSNDKALELGKIERNPQTFNFLFGSITANVIKRYRDGSTAYNAYNESDSKNGDPKVYVQGAAGYQTKINLFDYDPQVKDQVPQELIKLANEPWLINQASLYFHINLSENPDPKMIPERIFIYNAEDNKQIEDVNTFGLNGIDGVLEKDKDGKPLGYKVQITSQIKKMVKAIREDDNPQDQIFTFGVKVYNPTDWNSQSEVIKIDDYNWSPKGVSLFGSNIDSPLKLQLKIIYSKEKK